MKPDRNQDCPLQDLPFDITPEGMEGFLELLEQKGVQKSEKLSEADRKVVCKYLSTDRLLPALVAARMIEKGGKPREDLQASGTLRIYDDQIRWLREAHANRDAFSQFSMLTKHDAWSSSSMKSRSKSALNRRASDLLTRFSPVFLVSYLRRQLNADENDSRDRRLGKWLRQRFSDAFLQEHTLMPDHHELLELAGAVRHLEEFPPDLHGRRSRRQIAEKSRERRLTVPAIPSAKDFIDRGATEIEAQLQVEALKKNQKKARQKDKKSTLSRITAHERKHRRTDPDFDFRTALWREVAGDTRMHVGKKASTAVLMSTGCRPVDLVHGVTVHVLRARNTDDAYRLLVRIPPSKFSDDDFFDEEHEHFHSTPEEAAELAEMRSDEAARAYNVKGHQWRLIELELPAAGVTEAETHEILAAFPEARWLADYVRRNGSQVDENFMTSLTADEREAFEAYADQVTHTMLVKIPHEWRDLQKARAMPSQDRARAVVNTFGDALDKRAKRVLPGLRARVTPYVLRHAFSSDLKAVEASPDDRSAALGHVSGRTVHRYGSVANGKTRTHNRTNRASQLVAVHKQRDIRHPATSKPDFKNNAI